MESQTKNEIKDLIESNLRQRVLGNTNPVKLGRCFEFLSNYYGFHRGGDRKSNTKLLCLNDNVLPQNQTELAQSYGITQQTMNNYMRMANMTLELEDLLETNIRQRGDVGGSAKNGFVYQRTRSYLRNS